MPEILTVSDLNEAVRQQLESGFPLVWVEGELSNLARPASGHLYFSLKDSGAQVRCALFRNRARLLGFRPADGTQVLARARVSLYAPRGDYQLIVEHMEESGDGALRRAFEALRRKLEAEGLFDPATRRPIPAFPRRVGVITSPSGAAIRDILSVLRRRFPALPVLVFPVPVQGTEAAPAIVRALEQAACQGDCDVLILARGGGSLEDLWAFNEESVARAIRACPLPVVSGVGHETDVTIADFAADLRAATPRRPPNWSAPMAMICCDGWPMPGPCCRSAWGVDSMHCACNCRAWIATCASSIRSAACRIAASAWMSWNSGCTTPWCAGSGIIEPGCVCSGRACNAPRRRPACWPDRSAARNYRSACTVPWTCAWNA